MRPKSTTDGRFSIAKKEATAGFLVRENLICLALKQKKVGAGLWMPYGGMVESGESYEDCMVRELREESRVQCTSADLEKVGILWIYKYRGNRWFDEMSIAVYLIHSWIGDPQDTVEMKNARWFHKDDLPKENMLPADREWVPRILNGKNLMVKAFYNNRYLMHPKHPPKIEEYIRPAHNP